MIIALTRNYSFFCIYPRYCLQMNRRLSCYHKNTCIDITKLTVAHIGFCTLAAVTKRVVTHHTIRKCLIHKYYNYHLTPMQPSIPIKEQCVFVGLLFIGHTTFVHFAALPPSTPRAAKPSSRAAPLARRASMHTARARARMPYNFST